MKLATTLTATLLTLSLTANTVHASSGSLAIMQIAQLKATNANNTALDAVNGQTAPIQLKSK